MKRDDKFQGQTSLKVYRNNVLLSLIGTSAQGGRGGGGFDRRSMSLNTGYAAEKEAEGIIEELFIHEGAHASLDGYHANVILFSYNSTI